MEFNYRVAATKVQNGTTGFLFEPETIKIMIGDKNEAGDMVSIQTTVPIKTLTIPCNRS